MTTAENLVVASLVVASLVVASLVVAFLGVASLDDALLDDAFLDDAFLDDASLDDSSLDDASFDASLAHSSFAHSSHDMSLASSSEESFFSSLKALIAFINSHVDLENYAIVIARFKCSKKSIKNKIILRCDREDKSLDFLSKKRRHSDTRLIQCRSSS
jgi:uncharacterized protein YjbI with pentapeptide repeats